MGTSKPMIVGGIPRDKMLGKLTEISDVDITTGDDTVHYLAKEINIKLSRIMKIQYKKGFDGHSSILLGNLKLDFSSNFNVLHIEQYLKNKGIPNPSPMQKELYSRDFTINTLLMDLNLKTIHDPIKQGIADIKSKIIRTCLSPEITLKEHNRIIRVIYLAAKLNFEVAPEIILFVQKNQNLIDSTTSEKSLVEKLSKAMSYNSNKTLELLKEMNLNKYVSIAEKLGNIK